jgi:hypothetical protein
MTTDRTVGYEGPIRVLDPSGVLLDIGPGKLFPIDGRPGHWEGAVEVSRGSGIVGKALQVLIDTGSARSAAVLQPGDESSGDMTTVRFVGAGAAPF